MAFVNIPEKLLLSPLDQLRSTGKHPTNSRFLEEFNDIKVISKGAFGQVYDARKKMEGKRYAVKRIKLDADIAESCTREVQVLSGLNHRNIVHYSTAWFEEWKAEDSSFDSDTVNSVDSWRIKAAEHEHYGSSTASTTSSHQLSKSNSLSNGSSFQSSEKPSQNCKFLFIQMELCQNKNLAHLLKTGLSELVNVSRVVWELLSAVDYCHEQKLVHRDLKPDNILFELGSWTLKLGDFGSAKKIKVDESFPTTSSEGKQKHTYYTGTIPYIAPEQLKSSSYNHKVDIYALAIILFELKMCPIESEAERADLICKLKSFQLPTELQNPRFKQLLFNMLSVDPDKRPEVKDILSECFSKEVKQPNPLPIKHQDSFPEDIVSEFFSKDAKQPNLLPIKQKEEISIMVKTCVDISAKTNPAKSIRPNPCPIKRQDSRLVVKVIFGEFEQPKRQDSPFQQFDASTEDFRQAIAIILSYCATRMAENSLKGVVLIRLVAKILFQPPFHGLLLAESQLKTVMEAFWRQL